MASPPISLVIRPRGRPIQNLPESIEVYPDEEASQIFTKIAEASKFSVHRLRITKGSDGTPLANSRDMRVYDTGLRNRSAVDVKDLGAQISWRTVFIIEYLGPLLIHPLFYYKRDLFYGTSDEPFWLQHFAFIMVLVHFAKRELETMFIHRFSLATMPVFNVFKNSAHYWFLSGINMAYWMYSPNCPSAHAENAFVTWIGIWFFLVGELCNLSNHISLRQLRRPGSTARGIPLGLGFDLVTCPNYLFELIAWLGIFMVTRSFSVVVFMVAAAGQMMIWSKKKERRYRKEFGDKYKPKRYTMIPGIW